MIPTEQYLKNIVGTMNSIDRFVMEDDGLVVYYKDLPNEPFMREFLELVEKHITA